MANKRIQFMVEQYGLEEIDKNVAAGKINGYYTIVRCDFNVDSVRFQIGASNDEKPEDPELMTLLKNLQDRTFVEEALFDGRSLTVEAASPISQAGFEEKVLNFFEEVTGYLSAGGYTTGSFRSGVDDGALSLVATEAGYSYLTSAEASEAEQALLQMQIAEAGKKERIFLGMLGGILGAAVGSVVYAFVSVLGYWAWASAIVSFALSYIWYRKFAGKIGNFGALFSFFSGTGGIFLGIVLSWAWVLYDHFKKYQPDLGFFEVFRGTLPFIFENPELKGNFLGDVFLWGGISVVIGIFVIVGLYLDNRDRFKIKRML